MNGASDGSWWSRNWKWFAPTGCLVLLLLFVGGTFLVTHTVMSAIKSSDAFREPLAMVQSHPEVVVHLGEPLEPGWLVTGSVETTPASGNADLVIPVIGPKGEGNLYVTAHKETGDWSFDSVVLEIEEKDLRINLLHEGAH